METDILSGGQTWLKYGNIYKCCVCGYMPTYIDIRGLPNCPKCGVKMKFYETDDGKVSMVFEEDQLIGE